MNESTFIDKIIDKWYKPMMILEGVPETLDIL